MGPPREVTGDPREVPRDPREATGTPGEITGGPLTFPGVPPRRENLPSHFKFKEYCPQVFRNLRERFGIDDQDYQVIPPGGGEGEGAPLTPGGSR